VWRGVRTMIEAKLALIAQIGDVLQIRLREFLRVAVHLLTIESGKEIVKGRTKIKATATPVADIGDALEIGFDRRLVPKSVAPCI
jgi:hypothetical protein